MKQIKRIMAAILSTAVIVGSVATTALAASEADVTESFEQRIEMITDKAEAATDVSSAEIDKSREITFTVKAQNSEYKPIKGVGFALYYVSEELDSTYEVKDVDKSRCEKTEMPLTDTEGVASVTFPGRKQGVYLVSCENLPNTVKTASDDFIIILPYTMGGETWAYTLEASPKLMLKEATQPASAVTSGGGNGLGTSGSKAAINTGDVYSSVCLLVALAFLSVGIVFLMKSKLLKNKAK